MQENQTYALCDNHFVPVAMTLIYFLLNSPTYNRIFYLYEFRIPFGVLTQVAFGNKFFSFVYQMRDNERNIVEKKMTCYVYNHTLARSLFRTVTEDQVFHYQPTVSSVVINHADNRETAWRFFCRKVRKIIFYGSK